MTPTECKAYRVDGQLFETKKQAEGAIRDIARVKAMSEVIGNISPQFIGIILGLVASPQQRENFIKFLAKLDEIDGIKKKSKLVKLK